jgi:hypothetical protein
MRWPKPDDLRQWTLDDQVVFRRWRRGDILFYGVAFCLLAVLSIFARRHDKGHIFPDIIAAPRQAVVSVNWRLQCIAVIDLACPYAELNFAGRPSALTCGARQ